MKYREGYWSERARDKSYKEILSSLNKKQFEVYQVVKNNPNIYNEKIAQILNIYPHQICPRILELREMGLVRFSKYGVSEKSGKTVSLWRINQEAIQIKFEYAGK